MYYTRKDRDVTVLKSSINEKKFWSLFKVILDWQFCIKVVTILKGKTDWTVRLNYLQRSRTFKLIEFNLSRLTLFNKHKRIIEKKVLFCLNLSFLCSFSVYRIKGKIQCLNIPLFKTLEEENSYKNSQSGLPSYTAWLVMLKLL